MNTMEQAIQNFEAKRQTLLHEAGILKEVVEMLIALEPVEGTSSGVGKKPKNLKKVKKNKVIKKQQSFEKTFANMAVPVNKRAKAKRTFMSNKGKMNKSSGIKFKDLDFNQLTTTEGMRRIVEVCQPGVEYTSLDLAQKFKSHGARRQISRIRNNIVTNMHGTGMDKYWQTIERAGQKFYKLA